MYCANCGKQLDTGAKFCRFCGAPAGPGKAAGEISPAAAAVPGEPARQPAPASQAETAPGLQAGQAAPAPAEEAAGQAALSAQHVSPGGQAGPGGSQPWTPPQPAAQPQPPMTAAQPVEPRQPAAASPASQTEQTAYAAADCPQVREQAARPQSEPQPQAAGPNAAPQTEPGATEREAHPIPAPAKKRGRRAAVAVAIVAVALVLGGGGFFAGWMLRRSEQESLPVSGISSVAATASAGAESATSSAADEAPPAPTQTLPVRATVSIGQDYLYTYQYDEAGNPIEVTMQTGDSTTEILLLTYSPIDTARSSTYTVTELLRAGLLEEADGTYVFGTPQEVASEALRLPIRRGVLTEARAIGADGTQESVQRFSYDGNGNLLCRIEEIYQEGTVSRRSEWTFDARGFLLCAKHYAGSGVLAEGYTEYELDTRGNPTQYCEYNELGVCTFRQEFTYDAAGRLLSVWCPNWDGSIEFTRSADDAGEETMPIGALLFRAQKAGVDMLWDESWIYPYSLANNDVLEIRFRSATEESRLFDSGVGRMPDGGVSLLKNFYDSDGVTAEIQAVLNYNTDGNLTELRLIEEDETMILSFEDGPVVPETLPEAVLIRMGYGTVLFAMEDHRLSGATEMEDMQQVGQVRFSYDSAGRLVKAGEQGETAIYVRNYYDADGRLLQSACQQGREAMCEIRAYDAQGRLCERACYNAVNAVGDARVSVTIEYGAVPVAAE